MKRYVLSFVVVLAAITLVFSVACVSTTPREITPPPPTEEKPPAEIKPKPETLPSFPLTVVDDLGREVKIEKLPLRIVSLAPSNTEILFALGLGDRIVGVTSYCDYPEEAKTKPRVGGFSIPDLERLVATKPDLVLAADIHKNVGVPAFEKLGLTVVTLAPKTMEGVLKNINLVGEIAGKSQESSRLVAQLRERVKAVTAKTEGLTKEQRPKVLYIVWHDPIWAGGGETFANDLIEKAGGMNIFAKDFSEWRIVSLEAVITKNPQVIIVSGMGATRGLIFSSIKSEPRLSVVEARAKGQVYEIDGNLIERSGPRIIEGLEQVAKVIHPEIFGKPKS